MSDTHTPTDEERQAALDAWEAWTEKPREKDDWATEGAALWDAAYAALDFSWDGLARVEDEVGYGPRWERTTAGSLKSWDAPDDFPGKPHLQDYWRTHREYWGPDGAFSDDELTAIGAAGIAEDAIYDERGFASLDAMQAAGHLRKGKTNSLHYFLHHISGAAESCQQLVDRLIRARLARISELHLTGSNVGFGVSLAIRAANSEMWNSPALEAKARRNYPSIQGHWSQLSDVDWRDTKIERAELKYTQFQGTTLLVGTEFHGNITLRGTQFHGTVSLIGATFHNELSLNHAQFHNGAVCSSANFMDSTFVNNAQFCGHARFDKALFNDSFFSIGTRFRGYTSFISAQFHGTASFDRANFHQDSSFGNTKFREIVTFENAHFHKACSMDGAQFYKSTSLNAVHFSGTASLVELQVGGDALFERITFDGIARLDRIQFRGKSSLNNSIFYEKCSFLNSLFNKNVTMNDVEFSGTLKINRSEFRDSASFMRTQFKKDTSLNDVRFFDDVHFNEATFAGDTSLINTKFNGKTDLKDVTFNAEVLILKATFFQDIQLIDGILEGPAIIKQSTFEGGLYVSRARFDQVADFRQTVFGGPILFTGAAFGKGVDLTGATFTGFERAHQRDRRGKRAPMDEDKGIRVTRERPVSSDQGEADALFGDYETAFRKLKLAAEEERDQRTSQRMHRLEQIARRHRRRDTTWVEKLFSYLYGAVADYGEAILRPIFWGAGVLPVLFAALFIALAWPVWPEPLTVGGWLDFTSDAYSLAFTNAIRPFMVWNPEAIDAWKGNDVLDALRERVPGEKGKLEKGHLLLPIRFLSTLQSILTLPCFFLSALALRRRFQLD